MKNSNYVNIQGWMVNDLDLKGNDLIAYAIIYGFSQDGQSEYTGSINYLCKWLNCSRPTVIKSLKNLTERCLITKTPVEVNGVIFNKYVANVIGVKADLGGSKETLPLVKNVDLGSKETLLGGSKETLPNNKLLNNKEYNNTINNGFDAVAFKNQIPKDEHQTWRESWYMKFRTKPGSLSDLLDAFNIHLGLKEENEKPKNIKDYKQHFYNWCNVQDRIQNLHAYKKGKKEGAL